MPATVQGADVEGSLGTVQRTIGRRAAALVAKEVSDGLVEVHGDLEEEVPDGEVAAEQTGGLVSGRKKVRKNDE